ncbi:MAG TPA: MATE family efflux transporter [Myxococcales bacterium]|nr:MATE family efflux transporter [Myxococcales bacterium]HIM00416.1 MATE family efflux transporter [Myxococcales bacterium]
MSDSENDNESEFLAPNRSELFRMAWPIVVANSSVPLLGLADTAIIGHTGTVTDLGAIALGALIFTFVYWGFGFLRMGTTGFVAQASGAADEAEVRATVARALVLAIVLGVSLVMLQRPIVWASLWLLGASEAVEHTAEAYFLIRIWGAPASLCMFALMGCFVGLGQSRTLLLVQLFLNGVNIVLDLLLAGALGWGAEGIALGTAIAEWTSLILALFLARQLLRRRHSDSESFWPWPRIKNAAKLAKTLTANFNILLRTLILVSSFALFTNQAAKFGDTVLAANHILLQMIGFSAYFLDGFAFVAEAVIGQAIGARRRMMFDAAVSRSSQLAAITALGLALATYFLGDEIVAGLTTHASVRNLATQHVPYAAIYILFSFGAFQLDGIFIGATRTRDMRNAAALSMLVFLIVLWSSSAQGYRGLWIAFIAYVIARALSLMLFYPSLRRSIEDR